MPFQRRLVATRRAQNLPAGRIFDGVPVKSAFALFLTKVTKPRMVEIYRWEMEKCRER